MKELVYTIQFTEEELNQLNGDLYYYYRDLLDKTNKYLEDELISQEDKKKYTIELAKTANLVHKLDTINNQIPTSEQVFVLKEVE